MLLSNRCNRLSSKLISMLKVIVRQIILILVQIEVIGFLQETQNFLNSTTYRLKIFEVQFSIVKLHLSDEN